MSCYSRSLALGAGFFVAALSSAYATDFTVYNGGNWDDPDVYTLIADTSTVFPTNADNIVGLAANNKTVRIAGSQAVNNFTIDSSSGTNSGIFLGNGAGATLTIVGALTKSGGGTLEFRTNSSDLNLSIGSISVSSGELLLGSGSSASRQITSLSAGSTTVSGAGAILSLFVGTGGTTATIGALNVNTGGVVNIRQGSTTVANTSGTLQVASLTGDGTVQITSKAGTGSTGTLAIVSTADASFSGVLADGSSGALSVAKSGDFTQTLSGNSNIYTGGTTISGGTLLAANASGSATGTGAVSVTGGTLAGTGFIGGASSVTAGKLAAGTDGTVGTLTFNSTLDLSALTGTGGLQFDLAGTGASDKIVLSTGILSIGTGTLEFSDFSFTALSGFGVGTYTLIDTSTSISGTFGPSLSGSIGAFNGVLSKSMDGQDIILTVTAGAIPEPATSALLVGGALLVFAINRRRRSLS